VNNCGYCKIQNTEMLTINLTDCLHYIIMQSRNCSKGFVDDHSNTIPHHEQCTYTKYAETDSAKVFYTLEC